MNEIGHIERLEVMMTDLYGSILAQQELINKLDCKLAVTHNILNGIEAKLAQLKRKLKEADSQKAVTNHK